MSATVILTIYFKGLSKSTVDEIKKNLDVSVNNEQSYNLDPNRDREGEDGKIYTNEDEKKGEYTIQWRNKLAMEMSCNIFMTPFELLDLSITFALRTIVWNLGDQKINVKMNFMDSPRSDLVTKFSMQESEDFGEYGIAESTVHAAYLQRLGEPKKEDNTP